MKTIIPLILLLFTNSVYSLDIPQFPFIYVKGTATENIPPNQADVSFQISTKNSNYNDGFNEILKRSKTLITYLNQLGEKVSRIESYSTEIKEEYQRDGIKEGYGFKRKFKFLIKDLDSYAEIINAICGIDQLEYLDIDLRSSQMHEFEEKLMLSCLENAKTKATKLAKQANREIESIYSVSQVKVEEISFNLLHGRQERIGYCSMSGSYALPEDIQVSRYLYVLYKLKENK